MSRRRAVMRLGLGWFAGLMLACGGCGGPDATGTAEAPPKEGGAPPGPPRAGDPSPPTPGPPGG